MFNSTRMSVQQWRPPHSLLGLVLLSCESCFHRGPGAGRLLFFAACLYRAARPSVCYSDTVFSSCMLTVVFVVVVRAGIVRRTGVCACPVKVLIVYRATIGRDQTLSSFINPFAVCLYCLSFNPAVLGVRVLTSCRGGAGQCQCFGRWSWQ